MPGLTWRQPFYRNATAHQDAYSYNGTVSQEMAASSCDSFNRLYDDNAWLMSGTIAVLSMQAGFALLEAGSVRDATVANIMMKNIMDAALGAFAFMTVGWALAWGESDSNGLLGTTQFFLVGCKDVYQLMWHFSFAATASTIDSGAVAERMDFVAYLIVSTVITGVIYPIVCHWVWHPDGWLYTRGYFDFAGSGAVHALGGVIALTGAIWLGPRVGRLRPSRDEILATVDVKASVKMHVSQSGEALAPGEEEGKYMLRIGFRGKHEYSKAAISSKDGQFPPLSLPAHWDMRTLLHAGDALVVELLKGGKNAAEVGDDPQAFMKNGGEIFASAMMPLVKDDNKSDAKREGDGGSVTDDDDDDADLRGYFTEDDSESASSRGRHTAASGARYYGERVFSMGRTGWETKNPSRHDAKTAMMTRMRTLPKSIATEAKKAATILGLKRAPKATRFLFSSRDECATTSWREDLPAHAPAHRRVNWCLPMKRSGAQVGFVKVKAKYTLKTALYDSKVHIELSSPINMLYGAFVLWMGWYGFNSTSVGPITQGRDITVAHVVLTTTIGACSGIMAAIMYTYPRCGYFDITATACGLLGGLVSITGCANVIDEWAAMLIGGVGGALTIMTLGLLEFFQVDDACGAVAVHLTCGVWSMLSTGLFHNGIRVSHFKCLNPESEWHPNMCNYDCDGPDFEARGLFFGGGWSLLWVQFYGTACIMLWGAGSAATVLWGIENILKIPCRVTLKAEMLGLDVVEHGYDLNGKMVAALQASDMSTKIKSLASKKTYDDLKRKIVRAHWKSAISKVVSAHRAAGGGAKPLLFNSESSSSGESKAGTAMKSDDDEREADGGGGGGGGEGGGGGVLKRTTSLAPTGAEMSATAAAHDAATRRARGEMKEEVASLRDEVKTLRDMIKMLVEDKLRADQRSSGDDDGDSDPEYRAQLGPNSAPRRGARATEKDWDITKAASRKKKVEKLRQSGLNLTRGAILMG